MRLNKNKGLRSRYAQYMVSIYFADDIIGNADNDRLNIPLIRLFSGTVVAENERMAAANGWIEIVGQYRQMRMGLLHVPDFIREAVVDPKSVSAQLIKSSLCTIDGSYLLDNLVEVWFISVQKT